MTAVFLLITASICLLAAALLTRALWWPFGKANRHAHGEQEREERPGATPPARPSPALAAALVLMLFVVAGGGYYWIGSPSSLALGPGSSPSQASGGKDTTPRTMTPEQISAMVDQLAERMKTRPDDAEGWRMLARSYVVLGKHAQAVEAFKQAARLLPDDAVLLADYAEALAITNGRSLEGEPAQLIAHALQIDPRNSKALALAGAAAFNRKDYKGAVQYWEALLRVEPADSRLAQEIRGAVAEARRRAGLPPIAASAP